MCSTPSAGSLSTFLSKSLLRRVGGGKEDVNARMVVASFLDIYHALFLAISVAGLANVVTTWAFFAVDFLFNAFGLFKIYKAAKKSLVDVGEEVLGLVQGMFIGFVVSLAYLASLLVIFHGPNAEVMGNIKNSYFDFAAISDLESTVRSILLIVGIETATSLATIGILQLKCKINPALVFLHLMKEYGFIITAQMLYWFYLFFCLLESEFLFMSVLPSIRKHKYKFFAPIIYHPHIPIWVFCLLVQSVTKLPKQTQSNFQN